MTTTGMSSATCGELLRRWRTHRRASQLELSNDAAISARHLSFIETGRSHPSREMILRIADYLDVPLRDRKTLLLAAGFAPQYPEHDLTAPEMISTLESVREVLTAHEPCPAPAVDRMWNVVEANAAVDVLTRVVSPALLDQHPLNALRLTLHPEGMAPHIANLTRWRASVLGGLHRSALARADAEMLALHDELAAYPHDGSGPGHPGTAEPSTVYVPLILRIDGVELSFLAMIATFGTALDITLSELAIETFLPADPATAAYLADRRDVEV